MPTNNGVYSLPPIYFATPGTRIMSDQHNTPFQDVAGELNSTVRRDGSRPMQGDLPMAGRKITGMGEATLPGDAVTFGQVAAAVSAGVISMYGGDVAPSGSLLCNGAEYSTASYPALFSAIGYKYGGSGALFRVPNMQGRVPVGAGAGYGMGSTGGAATVALTEAQMPSHQHGGTTTYNGDHNHTPSGGGNFVAHTNAGGGIGNGSVFLGTYSGPTTSTNGGHTHGIATDFRGSGQAHNNMQPYVVVNYIIKT